MLLSPLAAFDPPVPACAQQTAGWRENFRCRRRCWQPPPTHTALLFLSHGPGRSLLDTRAMKHASIAPGTHITSAGATNDINPAVFVRAQSGGRRRHNRALPVSHLAGLVQHHHTPALESAGRARELLDAPGTAGSFLSSRPLCFAERTDGPPPDLPVRPPLSLMNALPNARLNAISVF